MASAFSRLRALAPACFRLRVLAPACFRLRVLAPACFRLRALASVCSLLAALPATASAAVRAGDHRTFGRIVLDWGRAVAVERSQADGELRLVFAETLDGDVAAAAARLPSWLVSAETSAAGAVLRLKPGVTATVDDRVAGKLVIDLRQAASAAARPPPVPVPRPPLPETVEAAAPDGMALESLALSAPEAGIEPAAAPPVHAGPKTPPKAGQALPRVVARRMADGTVIDMAAPALVAAAVFRRGASLWLVFGMPAKGLALDPSLADSGLGPVEIVPHPELTVLRLPAPAGGVAVSRRDAVWSVRLGGEPGRPAAAASWPPRQGRIAVPKAAVLGAIEDAALGDRLGVALLADAGLGEPAARRGIEFELLESAQGVVWRALADEVTASLDAAGAVIGRPADQAPAGHASAPHPRQPEADPHRAEASPATDSHAAAMPPEARHAAAMPAEARHAEPEAAARPVQPPRGLIDLASAGNLPGATFRDRRRALESAVAAAAGDDRPALRLDLARLLLSEGLAAEAAAGLANVGEAGASASSARALSGVAALLRGQVEAAVKALGDTRLDGDAEVALWRAVAAASREDWRGAIADWQRARGIPAGYPDGLRGRLAVVGARIELMAERSDAALAILDRLRDLPLPPELKARARLVEAMALKAQKALRPALAALADATAGGDPETRLEAELLQVSWDVERGTLTAGAGLAELLSARPAWRGLPREPALLGEIGRLRAAQGDFDGAVAAWREALQRTPHPRTADRMRAELQRQVAQALLGDTLSPLDALSLYREVPDLLPEGAALAEIERQLALRLAEAGIDGPAERLLRRQPDLAGSAALRAAAGAALAEARLADGDMQAAQDLLQVSGPETDLAEPLAGQRRSLLARARAQDGPWSLRQAWRAGDWEAVATASRGLLDAGPGPDAIAVADAALRLALAQARLGQTADAAATGARYADIAATPADKALLAMLAADAAAGSARDPVPLATGIAAIRGYLAAAATIP